MTFSVFTPEGPGPFPVLIWLSGLTCTEDNFTTKAGAYVAAAQHGVIVVAPDTSPRGEGVADDAAYDLRSVVTLTLTPTSTGTHLRMEQSGFRPGQKQAYNGAHHGWQGFFGALEKVLARID